MMGSVLSSEYRKRRERAQKNKEGEKAISQEIGVHNIGKGAGGRCRKYRKISKRIGGRQSNIASGGGGYGAGLKRGNIGSLSWVWRATSRGWIKKGL